MFYIILPMTGFEPQTSGSGSRRFATLATPRLGQVWLKIKPVSLVPCQGELKSWSSVFAFVIKYSGRWRFQVRGNQCDQIWQIFATLANVYKSLTNFDGLFLIWQNDESTLENLWHYWANFQCCIWPNIEKSFNHQVTLEAIAILSTVWPDGYIIFLYLAIYNSEKTS